MSKSSNPGCTISLDGMVLLTIALAVLRAYDKITCSWWWVFAPIWGPVALGLLVLVVWFVGFVWASTRKW